VGIILTHPCGIIFLVASFRILKIAILELNASLPPRRITEFPDFKQGDAVRYLADNKVFTEKYMLLPKSR